MGPHTILNEHKGQGAGGRQKLWGKLEVQNIWIQPHQHFGPLQWRGGCRSAVYTSAPQWKTFFNRLGSHQALFHKKLTLGRHRNVFRFGDT